MYLVPDGEELEIASAAADYLAAAMPIDRLHHADSADMDAALRTSLGEMGWFGLSLPDSAGGSGLSPIEHALFFREAGRQCGPIDVLTQCLAAMVADHAALHSDILDGKVGVSLVVADGAGFRTLGSPKAQYYLRADRQSAELYPTAEAGAQPRASLDPATSQQLLSSLPAAIAALTGDHVWTMGQLGSAAMLVGIAEAALDQIVEYAKVRETFGRKIGSWQAVRHPCADMAVRVEAARSQLWYAAAAMKELRADAAAHLDAAKHLANQAAVANADSNIQLHGGIGVTDEHHAHLYLKHGLVLARMFGGKRELLGRMLHARVED